MKAARLSFDLAKLRQNICALQEVLITFSIIHTSCLFVLIGLVSITIPNPAKVFRPPSKPLSCVRQCNSRYHSAMEHGSFLAVFPAPLTRPALPSQSFRHRRRSPHRVCPASRTRPAAAIRRYGRSRALPTLTNSLSSY